MENTQNNTTSNETVSEEMTREEMKAARKAQIAFGLKKFGCQVGVSVAVGLVSGLIIKGIKSAFKDDVEELEVNDTEEETPREIEE